MDPYFELDIPRIQDALRESYKRQQGRWDRWKEESDGLSPRERQDVERLGDLLRYIGARCKTRGDKARLRSAVGALTSLLEPGPACFMMHCEHNHSEYAQRCGERRNPKRCKKHLGYLERKEAREAKKAGERDA